MVGRTSLVAGALGAAGLVLVSCSLFRTERGRTLPADRGWPVLYVALGDSTVEGIGATRADRTYVARLHLMLRDRYQGARVENLGVGGATSADVVRDQLPRAVMAGPDLITLSVGPNDITGRVGVEAFERNMRALFERLRRETGAVVVANLLPDLGVTPRFGASPEGPAVTSQVHRFNAALTGAAADHGVELVDLYGPSQREVPRQPGLVSSDGYHPSDAGYMRWAELRWQGIAARIPGA